MTQRAALGRFEEARSETLRRLGWSTVIAWVCIAAASAAELPTARPEEVGLAAYRLARIDAAMEQAISEQRMAGAVTLVARRGRVAHHRAYGLADIASKRPMRHDDLFRIYSMTKPVVSVALLMLYEEGKFQLDDPLERYVPSFANVKVLASVDADGRMMLEEPRRLPTIHDAFRHTAGLASGLGRSPVDARYRELGLTIDKLESLRMEVEALGTVPLVFHPGERWLYGLNHDVQAYLVEHFSGMRLDEFLESRLFGPLGMDDTVFGIPRDRAARFATSYVAANGTLEPGETATTGPYTRFDDRPFGTFGLSSTAMDYARFAQMLANGGELDGVRILGRKTVELMRQNHLPPGVATVPPFAPGGSGYGLGVSVTLDPAAEGNLDSKGSFGWSGASTTKFYIDPAEELVAVIMAQRTPFDAALLDRFQTLVYQAIVD
jgi:CubicO group peptidase (beta-lactamase class C family)